MGAYPNIAELLGRPNIAELLEQVSVGRRSGGGESVVIVATDSDRTESDTCISQIITILAIDLNVYHNHGERICDLS